MRFTGGAGGKFDGGAERYLQQQQVNQRRFTGGAGGDMEEGMDKVARDENLGREETENSKQTKGISPANETQALGGICSFTSSEVSISQFGPNMNSIFFQQRRSVWADYWQRETSGLAERFRFTHISGWLVLVWPCIGIAVNRLAKTASLNC